jgi:hypothetical protein
MAALSAPDPAFQVGPIDDAEYEHDTIDLDDVVHHSEVTDAKAVKRIARAPDRLDRLATDAAGAGSRVRESGERLCQALALIRR